jgi:hypothetical protein
MRRSFEGIKKGKMRGTTFLVLPKKRLILVSSRDRIVVDMVTVTVNGFPTKRSRLRAQSLFPGGFRAPGGWDGINGRMRNGYRRPITVWVHK